MIRYHFLALKIYFHFVATLLLCVLLSSNAYAESAGVGVKIKDLSRISSAKENSLVGYGIVTGLAGTGDSSRSLATLQSVKNILQKFGVNVPLDEMRSRNAATVMVTATLPAYVQIGNKVDVNVTSMGDARSLVGGTLLLTHLLGADQKIYALAQGPVSVGGYSYDLNGNITQKNHPTAAHIAGGAMVERRLDIDLVGADNTIEYYLYEPDFATADRIAKALQALVGPDNAWAVDAARVKISLGASHNSRQKNLVPLISKIENTFVVPDRPSRVVVNERTGTVVAGGEVRIAPITITHGDLNVAISTEFVVSQPFSVIGTGEGVRTQVIPQTDIAIDEEQGIAVSLPNHSTVAELVAALNKVRASSRDIITILQGVKRAGALHAELIIQ